MTHAHAHGGVFLKSTKFEVMKSGQFIREGPPTGRQPSFTHPFQCKMFKISCRGTLCVDTLLPHYTQDGSQLGTPILSTHYAC